MAVAGGMDTLSKATAALVLAIAVLVVVTNGAFATQDLLEKTNAEIDSRRLVQAVEVIDQKELAMTQVNFGMRYDAVTVESEKIQLTEGQTTVTFAVSLRSPLDNQTLPGTQTVCLKQNGSIYVMPTCDPADMTVPRGPVTAQPIPICTGSLADQTCGSFDQYACDDVPGCYVVPGANGQVGCMGEIEVSSCQDVQNERTCQVLEGCTP